MPSYTMLVGAGHMVVSANPEIRDFAQRLKGAHKKSLNMVTFTGDYALEALEAFKRFADGEL